MSSDKKVDQAVDQMTQELLAVYDREAISAALAGSGDVDEAERVGLLLRRLGERVLGIVTHRREARAQAPHPMHAKYNHLSHEAAKELGLQSPITERLAALHQEISAAFAAHTEGRPMPERVTEK